MQDLLKHHEDSYLKAGNRYRFTEQHVQSLMERMACPSPSKSAAKHTGSAGLSEASVATRLQAQLKKPSRRNTARSAWPHSNGKRSTARQRPADRRHRQEFGTTCRSRGSPYHETKKKTTKHTHTTH